MPNLVGTLITLVFVADFGVQALVFEYCKDTTVRSLIDDQRRTKLQQLKSRDAICILGKWGNEIIMKLIGVKDEYEIE